MRTRWLFLLFTICLTAGAAETPDAGENAVRVAEETAAATVGVYSRVGEFDRFYGSGAVISADGYILTSTTAVPPGASAVEVYFADHSRAPAQIAECHPEVEAVLLKTARAGLPFLPLRSAPPAPGETAYTSGNANNMLKLGDGASFSAGVVSAIYEIDNADAQSGYRGTVLETDCAVNPGQDGGPLVDAAGQIIGIVSRGFSPRRWQGTAVPLGKIIPRFAAFADGRLPAPTAGTPGRGRWGQLAEKFRPALVALTVKRRYPPEKIVRRDWTEFRAAQKNWALLDDTERRRITADFFAADSVLAANQMVRRPEGAVTGVLVSPQGHIATSVFNVTGKDRTFVDDSQVRLPLPPITDLAGLEAAGARAEFTVENPVYAITATLHDGRTADATIVKIDNASGIAILKTALTDGISYIDMALAGGARAGEEAALLGAAPWSVNTGIVSAEKREDGTCFQFDARLNYANSGGAVISRSGRFLGIAGAPLFPLPVSGRLLPFAPAALNQPALSDFTLCPNSGIGIAAHARRIAELLP